MNIQFTKMHGCGNDFIVIDNRDECVHIVGLSKFIKTVCTRKFHIGANGLMLLEQSDIACFSMRYFNADGSEGEMCGNGIRCIAKFAYEHQIAQKEMIIETVEGIYEAIVHEDSNVEIKFPALLRKEIQLRLELTTEGINDMYHFATIGVPHIIIFRSDIKIYTEKQFEKWAEKLRYNKKLFPQGTNVNIVHVQSKHELSIRTYERGVEEETLSCGSGATTAAIIATLLGETTSPVCVQTKGGILTIQFQIVDNLIEDISLTGNAVSVYTGEIMY